jgi:fatty-acyl-CoA synthase
MTSMLTIARQHAIGRIPASTAARFPQRPAVVWRDKVDTYAEFNTAINRTANALSRRGIEQGQRVALLSHNSREFALVYFALAKLGAISVPINFMLNADEVAFILEHAQVSGMIVEDALGEVARSALQKATLTGPGFVRGWIPYAGLTAPSGWESFDDWAAYADASEPSIVVGDDDPIQIMYTSGTESRPKGATLTSRSLIAQYVSAIVDGGMDGDDVEIHALPMYHCAQLHCFFTPGIYLGAKNIILPGADPATILKTIESEQATKLFCPPTVWIALLRHQDFDRRDLSSLKKGYYGASIMPIEVLRELGERLPSVRLWNFYGQTEMSPVATILKPDEQIRKAGSAGKPCINVQTILVDNDNQPVPRGTVGEIVHRGPHAMLGYWNDPGKTAEAFQDGWFHSGDLGVLDDEGYLTIVDRKKDMIKTGGENVASREVEEVLFKYPGVAEVAVFGIPHALWIEAVTAVVVPREGESIDPAQVISFVRERLAGFKTPKYVEIANALPKNATGKILKRELRISYAHLAQAEVAVR